MSCSRRDFFEMKRKLLWLPVFLGIVQTFSCSKQAIDPFQTPKVGEKFVLAPSMINKIPLQPGLDHTRPLHLLLNVTGINNGTNTPQESFEATPPEWTSIEVSQKSPPSALFTKENLSEQMNSAECLQKKERLKDLLRMQPHLFLVCDSTVANIFTTAKQIKITFKDSEPQTLTSWGTIYSEEATIFQDNVMILSF
jgi:hypothetical protein